MAVVRLHRDNGEFFDLEEGVVVYVIREGVVYTRTFEEGMASEFGKTVFLRWIDAFEASKQKGGDK